LRISILDSKKPGARSSAVPFVHANSCQGFRNSCRVERCRDAACHEPQRDARFGVHATCLPAPKKPVRIHRNVDQRRQKCPLEARLRGRGTNDEPHDEINKPQGPFQRGVVAPVRVPFVASRLAKMIGDRLPSTFVNHIRPQGLPGVQWSLSAETAFEGRAPDGAPPTRLDSTLNEGRGSFRITCA